MNHKKKAGNIELTIKKIKKISGILNINNTKLITELNLIKSNMNHLKRQVKELRRI